MAIIQEHCNNKGTHLDVTNVLSAEMKPESTPQTTDLRLLH